MIGVDPDPNLMDPAEIFMPLPEGGGVGEYYQNGRCLQLGKLHYWTAVITCRCRKSTRPGTESLGRVDQLRRDPRL